jgi:hypothetical protein
MPFRESEEQEEIQLSTIIAHKAIKFDDHRTI